jgi:hypothetical protein
MNDITGLDKVIAAVGAEPFLEFVNLKDFHYFRPMEERSYTLVIFLESRDTTRKLKIIFGGVNSLRIDRFGGVFVQLIGLKIRNISSRGLENLLWEVGDDGDQKLSFLCASVDVTLAD